MQKITSIEPKDYRLLDKGILAQINMGRVVGYNENGESLSYVNVIRNNEGIIHLYPVIPKD